MDLRLASLSFLLGFTLLSLSDLSWSWSRSAGQSITQHQSRWKPKSSRGGFSIFISTHVPPFLVSTGFFSLATLSRAGAEREADATCKCNALCHMLVREIKCTQPATLCRNNKSPPLSRWISSQAVPSAPPAFTISTRFVLHAPHAYLKKLFAPIRRVSIRSTRLPTTVRNALFYKVSQEMNSTLDLFFYTELQLFWATCQM